MLTLEQRKALVRHCTEHPTNTFYRELYGFNTSVPPIDISSESAWQQLLLLTKDHLVSRSMPERSFLPLAELDHVRASSGTSGKPPLFTPRTHVRNMEYRLQYHDFKKPFLAFGVPMMPHWHESVQISLGLPPQVITYDPLFPETSIRLATIAGADAASLFLFHVQAAGEEMKKTGLNERIRFLEVTGETCSQTLYSYMRNTFPNATILQSYGASEVEDVHIGIPCRPMDGAEPLAVYHPKATHFLEIIDAEGNVIDPKQGAEGDLLITAYAGEPSAFPLIRFKIGDTVRVVESNCSHDAWAFTVLGRTELDFLKVHGGILRADEIGRVLSLFSTLVTDEFELHRYERTTPDGPRTHVELHIIPRSEAIDLVELANDISEQLRIGPTQTYADSVRHGTLLPLSCRKLEQSGLQKKRRRIISHVE